VAGACSALSVGCRPDPASPGSAPPPDVRAAAAGVQNASAPRPLWPKTTIPLDTVPDGGRTTLKLGAFPVELQRTGRSVTARSLVCTHMGCTVAWQEATRRYACPCHAGLYDAAGRPLEGPPPRGLDPVPVTVSGGRVTLG
jgi:cytochrome b6-f complex iron-sulfur subunit